MYTAELYYNDFSGKSVTKGGYEFTARNINHAIRRMVKTVVHNIPSMHIRFNLWSSDGESVHVYINKVFGDCAGVTVADVFYPADKFAESFPG